uniref:Uncharacterized protein n=1 Tax=Aegilops tauschii subsp. strangulata TaxID=200361 RepID=A0A453SAQ9_AEGTS
MMVLAAAASAPSLQGWKRQISAVTCRHPRSAPRIVFRASATKNNERKRRRFRNLSKGPALIAGEVSPGNGENPTTVLDLNVDGDATSDAKTAGAPRSAVLQSCTLTSGLLLALGLLLREASHVASSNGLPFADPAAVSFNFETWHLELVAGLVILISSTRYILLQTWPDFRDSSEAANTQVCPTSELSLIYLQVSLAKMQYFRLRCSIFLGT